MTQKPKPMLWLSDARGVYIPRDFCDIDKSAVANVSEDDWEILQAGPDHELYWDTWTDVCDDAIVTDENGRRYRLYQDGDLWLVPIDMEWDDETEFWKWSDETGTFENNPDVND